jgi:hypothetical protein
MLLEMIYVVCALGSSAPCVEQKMALVVGMNADVCVFKGGSDALAWEKAHPAYQVKRVVCRRPRGREAI